MNNTAQEKKDIKKGSWVRILSNESGGLKPDGSGNTAMPWDHFEVHSVSTDSRENPSVYYLYDKRHTNSIRIHEVELIKSCICAAPLKKHFGCKCGYDTMIKQTEGGK